MTSDADAPSHRLVRAIAARPTPAALIARALTWLHRTLERAEPVVMRASARWTVRARRKEAR